MCFTVQLALKRHLIAVHKVYNYARYSRTQYMAEFEKQLSDTQGKCPVCGAHFDEDLQLRKHLRTHGMMYINTKRVVATWKAVVPQLGVAEYLSRKCMGLAVLETKMVLCHFQNVWRWTEV